MVIHASTASTANKPNAVHNRFISTTPTHPQQPRAPGPPQKPGAQGRIRTSVARKERQIYSLLPLTTRPPVHIRPSNAALHHSTRARRRHRPGIASPCCQRTLACRTPRPAIPAKLRNCRATIIPHAFAIEEALLLESVLKESCASRLACSCHALRRAHGYDPGAGEGI